METARLKMQLFLLIIFIQNFIAVFLLIKDNNNANNNNDDNDSPPQITFVMYYN